MIVDRYSIGEKVLAIVFLCLYHCFETRVEQKRYLDKNMIYSLAIQRL